MQPTDQSEAAETESQEKPAPKPAPVILLWSDAVLTELCEAMVDDQVGIYGYESHRNGLQPQRLIEAYQLLKAIGGLQWQALHIVPPEESLAEIEELKRFHDSRYCEAVLDWDNGQADFTEDERFGFSENGTAAFIGMADVAKHYVAAARTAVRVAVNHPTVPIRVVSLAGEQVHARSNQAESGDIFNDIALALLDAQALAKKVAFINLDAEHPIVIQELFFKERNVMTISLHEGPSFLYPGTGNVQEIGKGLGHGFNVNLPLPPGAGDAQLLQAFEQVIEPLLKRFEPNLLILLGGCSAHVSEPLAHLRLTSDGYQKLVERATRMVPRFVLLGGDGSDWALSARLWSLVLMKLAGRTMITDDSTSRLPYLGFEYRLNQLRKQKLEDAALSKLSQSMQEYVNDMLHMTLLEAQQLLFPLWNIPISAELVQIVERKLMAEEYLYQTASAIKQVAHLSPSKTRNGEPSYIPNNNQRHVIREDKEESKRKNKHRYVKDNRHERSTRHEGAHATEPSTSLSAIGQAQELKGQKPPLVEKRSSGERANNRNRTAQSSRSSTTINNTPRRSSPQRNPLSKNDQERKKRNSSRKRRQRRQNKKRGGGKA